MGELIAGVVIFAGGFGWGIAYHEWTLRRELRRAKENRIVFDVPFSPEQSERVMKAAQILADASIESMS